MATKATQLNERQAAHPKSDADEMARVPTIAYSTDLGSMYHGRIEETLKQKKVKALQGKVDLIFTSPPFPLVTKKRYGNETGEAYLQWLEGMSVILSDMLSPTGSIVLEVGNAWEKNSPTMSTLPLESLLAFKRASKLHLCQHIICHNPARLPSPAAWVTINKLRLKDTYTHVWWMSKVQRPKANSGNVLLPYSKDMQALLKRQSYNAGRRPSGHDVSATGFLTDRGGAISANVLDFTSEPDRVPPSLLKFSGTGWDTAYRDYCKAQNVEAHPARMQMDLAAFFIKFLTDEGDLVMDPFAGSNTTGSAAEELGRKWLSVEAEERYVIGSKGRFGHFFTNQSSTQAGKKKATTDE
jgi:site-specific DNA-methyltransferase (cytosine-N4-specific)